MFMRQTKKAIAECFFERIVCFLNSERVIILLGDFNCVCTAEDRVQHVPVRDQSALFLNTIVQEQNLEDIGSVLSNGYFPQ
ncbi:MAG: hypothetical protein PV344_09205, partial [Anaplasma sp.]|nr:hypothetical protein [Anaplasma sp.]